jgi:outer membrane protein
MKKLIFAALAASAAILPTAAFAQAAPVLVVDTEQVMSSCTACVAARTQLQTKQTAAQTRAQTLNQQLQAEREPIQKAVEALGGKTPDAALKQRVTAYQTKEEAAQRELATLEENLRSSAANVQQQIGSRLVQVVEQVRARRNAALVVSKSGSLANSPAVDVTTEVLAALNAVLTTVSVTPLPKAQQQPQGR